MIAYYEKRVFIRSDFDNDENLTNLLVGQFHSIDSS